MNYAVWSNWHTPVRYIFCSNRTRNSQINAKDPEKWEKEVISQEIQLLSQFPKGSPELAEDPNQKKSHDP